MKRYIAFDPGLDGGICVLDSGDRMTVMDDIIMPTVPVRVGKKNRRDYDERILGEIVRNWRAPRMDMILVIEKQQPFPKQGGVSNFTLGNGFGLLKGIAVGMGLPYRLVRPREWQDVIYEGIPGEGKERSFAACKKMWPENPLPVVGVRVKKFHEGCADARCIATWAARMGL